MKVNPIHIAISVVLFILIILGGVFLMYRAKASLLPAPVEPSPKGEAKAIDLLFTYSVEGRPEESYSYDVQYKNDVPTLTVRFPQMDSLGYQTELKEEEMKALQEAMDRAKSWHGFQKEKPAEEGEPSVSYRIAFTLSTGPELFSRGTNEFPEGFADFLQDLEKVLGEYRREALSRL